VGEERYLEQTLYKVMCELKYKTGKGLDRRVNVLMAVVMVAE
jgi:hypothetical protein